MIYFFDTNAGKESITIKAEMHKYLIKVRRHTLGDVLQVRSKESVEQLYKYEIVSLEARSVRLKLLSQELKIVKSSKNLHIAWCVVDAKSVEKVLPTLCEIGVQKISFLFCDRSQKNFKLDFKRFHRIVEASMQQSGRTDFMEFDTYKNIESFLAKFEDTKVFDFCENVMASQCDFSRVLIGCEGGFSQKERALFKSENIFSLQTPMVLRSESAVVAVASKILF